MELVTKKIITDYKLPMSQLIENWSVIMQNVISNTSLLSLYLSLPLMYMCIKPSSQNTQKMNSSGSHYSTSKAFLKCRKVIRSFKDAQALLCKKQPSRTPLSYTPRCRWKMKMAPFPTSGLSSEPC